MRRQSERPVSCFGSSTARPRKPAETFEHALPRALRRDVIRFEARLAVVAQQPFAAHPRRSMRRVPERNEPMLRRELEDLHAAELTLARLPGDVEDQIPIAHPGTPAATEADVVQLAEGFLRPRGRLQRRSKELPEQHLEQHQQQPREHRDARQPRDRHTGAAHHRQFAAARQGAKSEQRAEERGDRQQLVRLLRKVEQRIPQRAESGVVADADILLLIDEHEQRAEDQEHRHDHQHRAEYGADDVAIEHAHTPRVPYRRR